MTTSRPPELPGFEFTARLGVGGFGEVWLARDLRLQQERAVKRLRLDRCGTGREALLEEARVMARLPRHRNRVQIHTLVEEGENDFLVMEYVEGGPLERAQTSPAQPLPWERATRYAADVADALREVHAAGLLHRDIKPQNILWDRLHDEAVLADFGLAGRVGEAEGLAGTLGYLAPELFDGPATARSDVFALAATLFHLVAGRPPFDALDLLIGRSQARHGLSSPVSGLSRVPRAVEEAILAGLQPDPRQRTDLPAFQSLLRGAHLQALADRLRDLSHRSGRAGCLRTVVSTAEERELVFRPVLCEAPLPEVTRDMEYVPSSAPVAPVRTGDLVRLEITADADGYLTVLNLGSSGELKVIFPNPRARDDRIRAGHPHRLTVKLSPPEGTDRAAVIWTREPGELTPALWRRWIEDGQAAALPPQESTRGMDFVLHEAAATPGGEWAVDVVAITHRLPPQDAATRYS